MTTADLDIALDMTVEEHIEAAMLFLQQSQQEFAAGDTLQACEKLWGAAAHATIAYAQLRGWPFGDHKSMKLAVMRLGNENGDAFLRGGFSTAEKFHANFYHAFMQDFELENDPPVVQEFVHKMVSVVRNELEV
jgi:hypothetical protein